MWSSEGYPSVWVFGKGSPFGLSSLIFHNRKTRYFLLWFKGGSFRFKTVEGIRVFFQKIVATLERLESEDDWAGGKHIPHKTLAASWSRYLTVIRLESSEGYVYNVSYPVDSLPSSIDGLEIYNTLSDLLDEAKAAQQLINAVTEPL